MVTGFGAVILVTHDADRMAEFYRRVLGIELEPRIHDGAVTCPPRTGRFRMGVLLNQAEEDDGAKEPIQRGADHRCAA